MIMFLYNTAGDLAVSWRDSVCARWMVACCAQSWWGNSRHSKLLQCHKLSSGLEENCKVSKHLVSWCYAIIESLSLIHIYIIEKWSYVYLDLQSCKIKNSCLRPIFASLVTYICKWQFRAHPTMYVSIYVYTYVRWPCRTTKINSIYLFKSIC